MGKHPGKLLLGIIMALVVIPIIWNMLDPNPDKNTSPDLLLKKQVRMLFIGNGYTSSNNMSGMFEALANSIPDTPFYIQARSMAPGRTNLALHAANPEIIKEVASGQWDYIILQDSSLQTMTKEGRDEFLQAVSTFSEKASPSSHIILLATWARAKNSNDYMDVPSLKDPVHMQNQINLAYWQVAKKLKVGLVLSSDVWLPLEEKFPQMNLYKPDGSLPSIQGSYAVALAIYHRLFPKAMLNLEYIPPGLSLSEVKDIQSVIPQEKRPSTPAETKATPAQPLLESD